MAEVNIDPSKVEKVHSTIYREMSKFFKEDYLQLQKYIKRASEEYLTIIKNNESNFELLTQYYDDFKQAIEKQMNLSSQNMDKATIKKRTYEIKRKLREELKITSNILNDFFKASMKYNQQVLTFLTKEQQFTTIVIENEKGQPVVIRTTYEDYFNNKGLSISRQGYNFTNLVGRFEINTKKALVELENNIQKISLLGEHSLEGLNITYQTSIQDYDRFGLLLWKRTDEKQWHKMKVAGKKGDIRQAYAYFFFNIPKAEENTLFLSHLYNNLDYFYREGVSLVDNISGNIRPDLPSGDSVKGLRAQLPSLKELKTIAQTLGDKNLNANQINEEFISKLILKKGQYEKLKEGILTGLRNKVEDITDNEAYNIKSKSTNIKLKFG